MYINNEIRKKNPKFFIATIAIITAVMLLGTTAISTLTTSESVFAYRNSQATSQINDCGNGFEPTNVGCQNTASQIQGDKNTVSLSSQQTFPAEPQTCQECFTDFLTPDEIQRFLDRSVPWSAIEQLCTETAGLPPAVQEQILNAIAEDLESSGIDTPTIQDIIECLRDILGLPPTA